MACQIRCSARALLRAEGTDVRASRVRRMVLALTVLAGIGCTEEGSDSTAVDDLPDAVSRLICDDVGDAAEAAASADADPSTLLPRMEQLIARADELRSMDDVEFFDRRALESRLNGASSELGVLASGGEAPGAGSMMRSLAEQCALTRS